MALVEQKTAYQAVKMGCYTFGREKATGYFDVLGLARVYKKNNVDARDLKTLRKDMQKQISNSKFTKKTDADFNKMARSD